MQIQSILTPLREELTTHVVYEQLRDVKALRIFMESHVFAVWDFQSLMKALQRILTCVEIPWVPTIDADARRLVNEIVIDEESDLAPNGGYLSHFELYLQAMQDCEANTVPIQTFIADIRAGATVTAALQAQPLPPGVAAFVQTTMDIAQSGNVHRIAAAFAYGREAIIPSMFLSLVNQLAHNSPQEWTTLLYYLDRHISTDSEKHGPQAEVLVSRLCGDNPNLWAEAVETAQQSLKARVAFWNSIADSINKRSMS